MKWYDNISKKIVIICGDGTTFEVDSFNLNTSNKLDFNVALFEFPKIEGTLAKRWMPKGQTYDIEFVFSGDDYIAQTDKFKDSSRDSREWTIIHPLRGKIVCQPTSITIDDSKLNLSVINVSVIETIKETLVGSESIADQLKIIAKNTDIYLQATYSNQVLDTRSKNALTSLITGIYTKTKTAISGLDVYYKYYKDAISAINNASSSVLTAMLAIQKFMAIPSNYVMDIQTRFALIKSQYDVIMGTVKNFLYSPLSKIILTGMIVYSLSNYAVAFTKTLVQPTLSRNTILYYTSQFVTLHNTFINTLDNVYVEFYGSKYHDTVTTSPNYYIINNDLYYNYQLMVYYSISNAYLLLQIAKQERTYTVPFDTHFVPLVHKLMGLDADDVNINTFIKINKIGIFELIVIEKGRIIKYLV